MNKNLALLLTSLSLVFSSNALSEGFNDNYLQIGYGMNGFSPLQSELRAAIANPGIPLALSTATGRKDYGEKVIDIKGSIDIGNNYSVIGSLAREKGSWVDGTAANTWERTWKSKSNQFLVGMGKNHDLHPQNFGNVLLTYTQFTTSLMVGKNTSELESVRTINPEILWDDIIKKKTLINFSMGVRTISNFDIQWAAKYNRVSGNNLPADHQFELEATKYIKKNLALGAAITSHKYGDAKVGFFARTSF